MKRELKEFSHPHGSTGIYEDIQTDVLIVGAGFSGIYMLNEMRKVGRKTVIYEAGSDLGGTWRFNCYPGARVDSQVPLYQFSIPETRKDWTWTTNYPDYKVLRAYFDHVDKVLQVKKDVAFGSVVVDVQFNEEQGRWVIKTEDGRTAYTPEWEGIENFKGPIHHTSFWPEEDVDVRGKRAAIIGTGASGVQVIQAWGLVAGSLKVFLRSPNYSIPMRRKELTKEEQDQLKTIYPQLFDLREKTLTGALVDFCERNALEDDETEREAFYEQRYQSGGFDFSTANYKDTMPHPLANRYLHDFWAKKTRARINDPRAKDPLAPLESPYFFGGKRSSLETDFYEQFNRDTVELVDAKSNPIVGFTENGIKLQDGTVHELDVVCLATGFDTTTGSMIDLGVCGIHDTTPQEDWKNAAETYLGLLLSGYPNMFHLQAVVTIEIERQNIRSINPSHEAAHAWKLQIKTFQTASFFPTVSFTYMGGSIPGKPFELVFYPAGIPMYARQIRDALPGFPGFNIVKNDGEETENPAPGDLEATTNIFERLFGMPPSSAKEDLAKQEN
ncbi:flavin-containing monooxygenase [Aspergillus homomorphus CBS 101889]|uniref:Cyclohexanone monooxygenase n=1 Tax=Aspergillus homomorphus (strain CBS 101889) TaxID=1450537 RepID=A0A395HIW4_ASPHC|nr:cyclohexanone monooxygenase [Aspergillus homomorphus CBS 101889]RAL07861.1 cyclohexanone monooxygenase [Aspergillus homomorphus CBS 101889]